LEGDEPATAVAEEETTPPAEESAPAHQVESEAPAVEALLTVKIRQPSHEFTFGVGMTFVSYSLVLTPVV
jgi:hypothetical protein